MMKEALKLLGILAAAVAAALIIKYFVLFIAVVPSSSMEPAVFAGDHVLVSRINRVYKRGDVIVFYPDDEVDCERPESERGTPLLKRIVALPGERVRIAAGDVYINDNFYKEDYVYAPQSCDMEEITLGEGCYFVLGDNRQDSYDARFWSDKYVRCDMIIGKALYVFGRIR